MSDPAVEAATRVMKLVYAYPTPNRDLVLAAREVLKPIRELHHPIDEHGDSVEECSECRHRWPCDTAKLIYTSEELDR
ncbi:hypothetical protein I5H33_gp052 [Mycobacterium phage Emma]|uniref:Uncharacterized protein n=1 Tax=Mycobacterium phage Emma TaxID=2027893 RepID=A0A249XMM4_9CAUD|nr:hypothetical protein I5H33_gp052 [Mycobacterium phage Emma]ASZ72986.1 hypothetical protein SEA_EMMA_52 [Mycobacterium phage Emma]QNN98888.1 hypothetical protein PBI_MOVA_53 [Mycobacterium phage Mova]WAA20363.1 hypothetical protein SEA_VREDHORSE_52 [Mycobacterium phage VRedHorse]